VAYASYAEGQFPAAASPSSSTLFLPPQSIPPPVSQTPILGGEEGMGNIMNGLPSISIITPSYNQGRFIGRTIDSIRNQNYPGLEYIVMDGGSTDETLEILRKNEPWLTWISEKDRGQSHAINKGLRMTSGEVVGFLNSDDTYEPGALMAVGGFFSRNPDAVWVTGRCRNIDCEGKEIRRMITCYKNFWLRINSKSVLKILNFISQPATFWRRKVMESVGYMDEDLHYAMEYDYWLRISRLYALRIINKYLACFRIHPQSKAGSNANAQFDSMTAIARRYVDSGWILALHNLHRILTIGIYRRFYFREPARRKSKIQDQEVGSGADDHDIGNP
jgi:glycosyltransferase involved in cell wall biosynthesis